MSTLDFLTLALQRIGGRYLLVTSVAFLVFYVLFKGFFSKRRIQAKFPKKSDYFRDFGFSAVSILLFVGFAFLTFRTLRPYNFLYSDLKEYSTVYYLFTFVVLFFFHDAYFYAIHRLMHWPPLYRYVHLIHHKSTNPSPWTAYAFHPLEALLEGAVIPLMAFIVPVHVSVIGLLMIFQIVYNVYGHLGYELFPRKFHKTWIGRFVNTSVAHNLHHGKFHGNYGLYTLIWDRLFGTVREDYDATYEQVWNKG
jgi:sterol desaturase/sphingolipid hydroxylase (fatty acid hydroxylase superfamily)